MACSTTRSLARSLLDSTRSARPTTSTAVRSVKSLARPYSATSSFSPSSTSAPPPPPPSRPTSASGSRLYSPPLSYISSHVNTLLQPIGVALKDEVLEQACTHKSAVNKGRQMEGQQQEGSTQHGERLGFVGRRVLRMHYSLHLTSGLSASHPAVLSHYLTQAAVDSALETKELGASVGREWALEKAMRWREVRGPTGEMTGLYKSRGASVEALVGAVYTQSGIAASSALFEQLILPNLSLPPPLRRALEGRAE